MQLAAIFVIALKFLVPALIPKFPFLGMWGNYILDAADGDILQALGVNEFSYQSIDKFADLFSYIFMVIAAWRWQIRKTAVVLFIYRVIGQVAFFATRNELYFFYFQNFLEPLLLVYTFLIFKKGSEKKAYKVYRKHLLVVWFIVIAYKLWNEWYLHYANIDLSTIFLGINGGG